VLLDSRPALGRRDSSVGSARRCVVVPVSERVLGQPGYLAECAISLIWWPVVCALWRVCVRPSVVVVVVMICICASPFFAAMTRAAC
jgi:hypothetical protein